MGTQSNGVFLTELSQSLLRFARAPWTKGRDTLVILFAVLRAVMSTQGLFILLWTSGMCFSGSAQTSFMKSYGGSDTDVCNDLVIRADGQVAMAGSTQTPTFVFGSADGFLVRTDLGGILLDAAASGSSQNEAFTCVEALPDSGLFVVGYTSGFGANFLDYHVSRLDKNNNILWSRRIGGAQDDLPLGSALTHDGGIVIYGYHGTTATNYDHFVVKVSGTGALVWTRLIRAPNFDFGFAIERTPDNGFILCGEAEAYGANSPHIFVAKLAEDGTVTWRQVYASPGEDHGTGVIRTLDGGYAVTGYTFGFGATSGDAFLMKLTSTGAISWFRRYGDGRYQVATDLVQMPDSSYWITGHSSAGGFGNPNIFLVHTNKNGGMLSAQEFGHPMRTERANSMVIAPDGGLLIGGEMFNCPLDQFQALLMRTTPGGHCPGCDSLNVVYTSSAHTPTILTGFNLNSAGTSTDVVPSIQSVVPTTTLCSIELPLPVELLSFTGEAQGPNNLLLWSTATEQNNDRFEVERSADAATWEPIAMVNGAGNSQNTLQYHTLDADPFQLAYYRLRQVDLDGSFIFSEVIAVQREHSDGTLDVYPNPGTDRLTIRTDIDDALEHIELMTADGRMVLRATGTYASDRADLDVAHLPAGTYIVRVTSAGAVRSAPWVKVDR